MHTIQRSILARLLSSDSKRYSDLQIPGVGSNLFTYHLKVLKQSGYVNRTSWGSYNLTQSGKKLAEGFGPSEKVVKSQPKIIILIACQNYIGQWLLFKRKTQPLINQIGFPTAQLGVGDHLKDSAERGLESKTGLKTDLTHRGDGYITILENQTPVSEIMFHLFYGVNPTGYLAKASKQGEAFWSNIDDDFMQLLYLPSLPDLIDLIANSKPDQRFFTELNYRL